MKVTQTIALFMLITLAIAGCAGNDKTGSGDIADEQNTFTGIVLEPGDVALLIEPDEGSWVRNSADKISVSIENTRLLGSDGAEIQAGQIEKGQRVEISFTGGIAESYPVQISDCYEVRLISVDVLQKAEYKKISAKQAKIMMDENESYILLDVRTDEEFIERHISGAVLIPDYEIGERIAAELPDKAALILMYCRSGRRSANAAKEMIDMGLHGRI